MQDDSYLGATLASFVFLLTLELVEGAEIKLVARLFVYVIAACLVFFSKQKSGSLKMNNQMHDNASLLYFAFFFSWSTDDITGPVSPGCFFVSFNF